MREQGEITSGCMSVRTISISIKWVPVGSRINQIQLVPSLPTPPLGFWCFFFSRACSYDFPVLLWAFRVFAEAVTWSPLGSHHHRIHYQLQVLSYLLPCTVPTPNLNIPALGLVPNVKAGRGGKKPCRMWLLNVAAAGRTSCFACLTGARQHMSSSAWAEPVPLTSVAGVGNSLLERKKAV